MTYEKGTYDNFYTEIITYFVKILGENVRVIGPGALFLAGKEYNQDVLAKYKYWDTDFNESNMKKKLSLVTDMYHKNYVIKATTESRTFFPHKIYKEFVHRLYQSRGIQSHIKIKLCPIFSGINIFLKGNPPKEFIQTIKDRFPLTELYRRDDVGSDELIFSTDDENGSMEDTLIEDELFEDSEDSEIELHLPDFDEMSDIQDSDEEKINFLPVKIITNITGDDSHIIVNTFFTGPIRFTLNDFVPIIGGQESLSIDLELFVVENFSYMKLWKIPFAEDNFWVSYDRDCELFRYGKITPSSDKLDGTLLENLIDSSKFYADSREHYQEICHIQVFNDIIKDMKEVLKGNNYSLYTPFPIKNFKIEDSDQDCIFCCESIKNGHDIIRTVCNHSFHIKCVSPMLLTSYLMIDSDRIVTYNSLGSEHDSIEISRRCPLCRSYAFGLEELNPYVFV